MLWCVHIVFRASGTLVHIQSLCGGHVVACSACLVRHVSSIWRVKGIQRVQQIGLQRKTKADAPTILYILYICTQNVLKHIFIFVYDNCPQTDFRIRLGYKQKCEKSQGVWVLSDFSVHLFSDDFVESVWKPECFFYVPVSIDSIHEVCEGKKSEIFRRYAENRFDPNCCFSIYYGDRVKSLDLVSNNAEEVRTWIQGLKYLMAGISDEDSLARRQRTRDQYPLSTPSC